MPRRTHSPALYSGAWVLAAVGIALFLSAGVAAARSPSAGAVSPLALVAFYGAFFALTLSLAMGAWYQVAARAQRPAERYRGPSPLILFGVVLFGATAVAALLAALGWIAPESQSLGALATVALTTLGYFAAIWLFVVRTHALAWTGMGWPASWRTSAGTLAASALSGVALIVPTYIATVVVGGVVAAALGVQLPSALPAPTTVPDAIATVLAAVIIAPVGEEAFFRGFSLSAWWRDLGLRSALVRATLFFAAAHILNVTAASASEWLRVALLQFLVILPIGYALGWLFARRGIVASIAGHMTFNGIAVLLLVSGATVRL
ncbi:MAG: CPBP family intramembrane glutamic endopeptidase [Candidatus Limnocylindrales bacterium]